MFWVFYNLVFPLGYFLLLPKFLLRMRKRGGYREHFFQRFGFFSAADRGKLEHGGFIWIHAVSVGEVQVALRFMQLWRDQLPDARFALSVTTSTANKIAREQAADRDLVFYFPVDCWPYVQRVIRRVNPRAFFVVESEFWPNLLRLLRKRGVPTALINGRISDRSFPRYRKLSWYTHRVMELIDKFCMQGELDRERIVAMGADPERVEVLRSAKYDVAQRDLEAEARASAVLARAGFSEGDPVLMGGSTWPGEEGILLDLFEELKTSRPRLRLLLAPRHFERGDQVEREIDAREFSYVRRSVFGDDGTAQADVFLLDSTGELLSFYAAADVVFVGKSLTDKGGQNPIEPAMLGKPVIVGPHMRNFHIVMREFLADDAMKQIVTAEELGREIEAMLDDSDAAAEMGRRAAELVMRNSGALSRTVDVLSRRVAAGVAAGGSADSP